MQWVSSSPRNLLIWDFSSGWIAADNVLDDPLVGKWSLTANEALRGQRSLQIVEHVVRAAAARGLLVLLDMHTVSLDLAPLGKSN